MSRPGGRVLKTERQLRTRPLRYRTIRPIFGRTYMHFNIAFDRWIYLYNARDTVSDFTPDKGRFDRRRVPFSVLTR